MPYVLDIDNLTKISYIKEKGSCLYIYRVNISRIVVKILTQKTFKEKREVNYPSLDWKDFMSAFFRCSLHANVIKVD